MDGGGSGSVGGVGGCGGPPPNMSTVGSLGDALAKLDISNGLSLKQ